MGVDPRLVIPFEEAAGGGRNRLLVLVEALTGMTIVELQALTFRTLGEVLRALPKGTDHKNRAKDMLAAYKAHRTALGLTTGIDDHVFTAYDAPNGAKALRRESLWRIMRKAVLGVLPDAKGAFEALRRVLKGLIAIPALQSPVDDFFSDVHDGPHPDFDPTTGKRLRAPSTA